MYSYSTDFIFKALIVVFLHRKALVKNISFLFTVSKRLNTTDLREFATDPYLTLDNKFEHTSNTFNN